MIEAGEFGDITQSKCLEMAKSFAKETGDFLEDAAGNFRIKYDPASRRMIIGHAKKREIRTFYIADDRSPDPLEAAKDLARELSGL